MASKATAVLLFLLGNARFSAEDNAKCSARFSFFENKRLKGYVAKRFDSRSLLSCSQQCLRNTWCTSTNFKFSLKRKDEGTCELNKHEMFIVNENNNFSDDEGATFSLLHKVRINIICSLIILWNGHHLLSRREGVTGLLCNEKLSP